MAKKIAIIVLVLIASFILGIIIELKTVPEPK